MTLVSPDNRPHGITFHATIDVLESLGSDVFVYFTRELGHGVNSAELEELARDSGRTDSGEGGETIVARLDAATHIAEGQDAELWVDARAMHIFDPATGRNLSLAGDGDGGAASVRTGSGQTVSGQADPVQPQTANPDATATDILLPARLDPEITAELQRMAVEAFEILGCRGLARVDFLLRDGVEPVFNEINTFPGFSATSLYPRMWAEAGIPLPRLLDTLIDTVLAGVPA